jgi:RHS repeat-associated protein
VIHLNHDEIRLSGINAYYLFLTFWWIRCWTSEHDLGYTGHRYDDTTGLIYAKARYLDTETHGFLSPDPMIYKLPESYLLDPQQMNSYSYARNRITL